MITSVQKCKEGYPSISDGFAALLRARSLAFIPSRDSWYRFRRDQLSLESLRGAGLVWDPERKKTQTCTSTGLRSVTV